MENETRPIVTRRVWKSDGDLISREDFESQRKTGETCDDIKDMTCERGHICVSGKQDKSKHCKKIIWLHDKGCDAHHHLCIDGSVCRDNVCVLQEKHQDAPPSSPKKPEKPVQKLHGNMSYIVLLGTFSVTIVLLLVILVVVLTR